MQDPTSILITGASNGIGAALAFAYAAPGISLALTGRDAARLERSADSCRAKGAIVRGAVLDIEDAAALKAWIEEVDRAQPLDLVIANAGMTGGDAGDGQGETLADIRRMMNVNFGGVCNTLEVVIPAMRSRGRGQLALMSSLAALRGLPYSPAYCASKAALKAYGEAIGTALRPEGIEVAVILPGFVETRLSDHVTGPKPLMMSADRAAAIIRRRLARGSRSIAFPLGLHLATRAAAFLPAAWVDPILMGWQVQIRRYE